LSIYKALCVMGLTLNVQQKVFSWSLYSWGTILFQGSTAPFIPQKPLLGIIASLNQRTAFSRLYLDNW